MKSDTWKDVALCRKPVALGIDFFSAEKSEIEAAKLVCSACPARIRCRTAGENEEYGVWGGLSEADRRRLKREASRVA